MDPGTPGIESGAYDGFAVSVIGRHEGLSDAGVMLALTRRQFCLSTSALLALISERMANAIPIAT